METKKGPATAPTPINTLAEMLERRRLAELRLPPLACGCRDPQSTEHLEERCRYRRLRCA